MSATTSGNTKNEILISADSHVMEPANILKERVPKAYRENAPLFFRSSISGKVSRRIPVGAMFF